MNNILGQVVDTYVIRYVASTDELETMFHRLAAQFTPFPADGQRILDDLIAHYPEDRALMVVAERGGERIGGVLGTGSILRIIALTPEERGKGVGRRLLQTYEVGAMQRGVRMISLGAIDDAAKAFYLRMGYRGKSSMHKELPLPGRVLELRLRKLAQQVGDLATGVTIQAGEDGKLPPLF